MHVFVRRLDGRGGLLLRVLLRCVLLCGRQVAQYKPDQSPSPQFPMRVPDLCCSQHYVFDRSIIHVELMSN